MTTRIGLSGTSSAITTKPTRLPTKASTTRGNARSWAVEESVAISTAVPPT
ncbi:hypothetical protein O7626_28265 [Micromonospora sp. WMMD1102]|uniref:hypothetical protein n=1 Tax=Micromonospora sp. WMMD1102 TaxID=3016105 RepID=UPI0024152F82|nr:hypothetical protein [Micromonospora sp. WMMD1102]MDG4789774.1 hypothetical protein [Micromonospora sp. WMMD1102]